MKAFQPINGLIAPFLFLLYSLPGVASFHAEDMVMIPEGEFSMGCNSIAQHNGGGERQVFLDAFWVDQYEVTNIKFEKVFPQHKSRRHQSSKFCDECPVARINWFDARAYCQVLGKDLPTEAQWEKAAAATTPCGYSWEQEKLFTNKEEVRRSGKVHAGLELNEGTSPVGSYPPNNYGIYDMLGNVWEWTLDWVNTYAYRKNYLNPRGPKHGNRKIRRGGAWSDDVRGLLVSWRDWSSPDSSHYADIGFRCVLNSKMREK